jgi:hypothetical protein
MNMGEYIKLQNLHVYDDKNTAFATKCPIYKIIFIFN